MIGDSWTTRCSANGFPGAVAESPKPNVHGAKHELSSMFVRKPATMPGVVIRMSVQTLKRLMSAPAGGVNEKAISLAPGTAPASGSGVRPNRCSVDGEAPLQLAAGR